MLPSLDPTSALLRTRRFFPFVRGLAATACLVALLGCGEAKPDRVAVHPAAGTVTFKGQPAHGASLTLHLKTAAESVPAPRANVEKDGSFKLSTFNGGDGAPEGEYVVTVRWYKLVKEGSDLIAGPNVIPPKYTNPQSSNLTVRIAAGENALPPIKL
ncbi:MAG: hypothetical protein H0T51_17355 [Pirellulales bacterium]|nr:hypothetical protein [Pirellulales bacterium]